MSDLTNEGKNCSDTDSQSISVPIPTELINRTLKELLDGPTVDISRRGNRFSFRSVSEKGTLNVEYIGYKDGFSVSSCQIQPTAQKKDLQETVVQMRDTQNLSYADIAKNTGMSVTYARRLYQQATENIKETVEDSE